MKEFNLLIDGYNLKQEDEWYKIAQLAAWIMSPHTKRPISAKKLLGPSTKQNGRVSQDEKEQILCELDQEFLNKTFSDSDFEKMG